LRRGGEDHAREEQVRHEGWSEREALQRLPPARAVILAGRHLCPHTIAAEIASPSGSGASTRGHAALPSGQEPPPGVPEACEAVLAQVRSRNVPSKLATKQFRERAQTKEARAA